MDAQVVVWNADVRYRPELEVEIEIVLEASDIPGCYYARRELSLEVELELVKEELEDPWFLSDDDLVPDEHIYDVPPRGYANAYAMAI